MYTIFDEGSLVGSFPTQVISLDDGVLLRRGCTEVKISGEPRDLFFTLQTIFELTEKQDVSLSSLLDHPYPYDTNQVLTLIQDLVTKKFLFLGKGNSKSHSQRENHEDVFFWHFGISGKKVQEKVKNKNFLIFGENLLSRKITSSLSLAGAGNIEHISCPFLNNSQMADLLPENSGGNGHSLKRQTFDEWGKQGPFPPSSLAILTSDLGNWEEFLTINQILVKKRIPFLPVMIKHLTGFIGPLVIPGESACLKCFKLRQKSHFLDPTRESLSDLEVFEGQQVIGFPPSLISFVGELAFFEILKFICREIPQLHVGTLLEFNPFTTTLIHRKVLKVPRCPVCSSLNTGAPMAIGRGPFTSFLKDKISQ